MRRADSAPDERLRLGTLDSEGNAAGLCGVPDDYADAANAVKLPVLRRALERAGGDQITAFEVPRLRPWICIVIGEHIEDGFDVLVLECIGELLSEGLDLLHTHRDYSCSR
jgi:hypothetical protein